MAHYDLYKSLSLSTASSTEDIAAQLDSRIATLRAQGIQDHQAELQEPLTARAILGDPTKRETYDRMLADPTGPEIGIQQLRELASHNPWAAPKTTSFDSAKQFSQQALGNFQTKIAAEAVGKPLPANAGLRESWKGSPTMVKVLAILCFVIAGLNLIRFMVWMFGIGEFTSAFKKELSSSSSSSSSTLSGIMDELGNILGILVVPLMLFFMLLVGMCVLQYIWSGIVVLRGHNSSAKIMIPAISFIWFVIQIAFLMFLSALAAAESEGESLLPGGFVIQGMNWINTLLIFAVIVCAVFPVVRAWLDAKPVQNASDHG